VFDIIYEKENNGQAPDYKSDAEKLKAWFAEVLPDYDRDKVYTSDIKKVAHWYNLLHNLNLLVKDEPEKKEETSEPEKKKGSAKTEKAAEAVVTGDEKSKPAPKKRSSTSKSKKEN
jgi:hypothetical protein